MIQNESTAPQAAQTPAPEAPAQALVAAPTVPPCLIEPGLQFKKDMAELGANTYNRCFQCATCSSTCTQSPEKDAFPRKELIWMMWGLKDRIVRDPDIWACHYCGQCSLRCPRGANPGESMMALRRYAITQYDWTGLSKRLYRSLWWEIGAVVAVAMAVVGLFALSGAFAPGRMITTRMSVGTFIPVHLVHISDWVMAGLLTFFLATNSLRMALFILNGQKAPFKAFLMEARTLMSEVLVQGKWRECKASSRWFKHFILVTGYVTMFTIVMFFLKLLQVDDSRFTWISLLGYYATFAILYYSIDAMIGRLRKKEEIHRFSHSSDWMFLILLFMTGLTGIVMHIFRISNLPRATYYTYVVHLAFAVPMLVVEVPFMKWAHLAYRPLALYLKGVKERAQHPENWRPPRNFRTWDRNEDCLVFIG